MQTIKGKPKDLGGGLTVARVLPAVEQRMVGPFIFFDHFGPVTFEPGKGVDVRPHPHIGLATVTYLFDGSQMHRDSLGFEQEIRPGDVNWMTAGRGIVHSERTGPETRAAGHLLHGIQSWVALPKEAEEVEPSFFHHPAHSLPEGEDNGVAWRLIVGRSGGVQAPVKTFSDIFYLDLKMQPGGRFVLPAEHEERGAYLVEGRVMFDGEVADERSMTVFEAGAPVTIEAQSPARVMLLGGAAMDGPRHIEWNFVSSDKARIEKAKEAWRAQEMGTIAGETEFIPLPGS